MDHFLRRGATEGLVSGRATISLLAVLVWATSLRADFAAPEVTIPDDQLTGSLVAASDVLQLPLLRLTFPGISGSGYAIAVLDTGVDYTHPAFGARYLGGTDVINSDSDPRDDNGHGTHVAGIAVSADATYGGLAPGAGLVGVKVLNSAGNGTWAQIEQGLQWVLAHRVEYNIVAVNLSIGTQNNYNNYVTSSLSNELAALKNAGVFIAAAAGNYWYSHSGVQGVGYPAADISTVAVGATLTGSFGRQDYSTGAIDYTTDVDRLAAFSERSTTMLDILAPGANITSCNYNWEGDSPDWTTMRGTSMAAPMVAGLALLMRQAIDTYWPPEQRPQGAAMQDTILRYMQETGVTVFDGDDEDDNVANLNYAFKRIDAYAAIAAIVNDANVPEPATFVLLATGMCALMRRRR